MDHKFYGITQDPETKNYMLVLSNKCKNCYYTCNAIYFQQQFIDWTSGNNDIDKVIQDTQLSTHNVYDVALEWIPYNRLYDIKYILKAGMYRANWIDGYIKYWDGINQNWKREGDNTIVILKSLNNSADLILESINEV
jgi:hypothetical protein